MFDIVIVGLGLIGGSVAKALKAGTKHRVLGMDTDESSVLDALSCGAIDDRASVLDIKNADIIYLCTYPDAAVDFVQEHEGDLKHGCIVTDTCGVKQSVCGRIEALRQDKDFLFVGAHPMAGKEKSGFSESTASLFSGASYIITPGGAPEAAVNTVSELARSMGFGRIILTTPEKHDRLIAFTSQVPHVLACAYVMSPSCEEHRGFSAGSYRDVSRVADINAELWSGLFLENREELTGELDCLMANIKNLRDAVFQEDREKLKELLQEAGDRKRSD